MFRKIEIEVIQTKMWVSSNITLMLPYDLEWQHQIYTYQNQIYIYHHQICIYQN